MLRASSGTRHGSFSPFNASVLRMIRLGTSSRTSRIGIVAGSVPRNTLAARAPARRPTSTKSRPTSRNVPRSGFPGVMLNTGMPACRAVSTVVGTVDIMTLSPGIQNACAPRAMTELTASTTADVLSTFASSSVIPNVRHVSRAAITNAREFASAGFHAVPTILRPGRDSFTSRNTSLTGRNVLWPTMCFGCFMGLARSRPIPATKGSATTPKT